ncbi:unnamed protein product [Lymnaea stagnalis]|uniref:C3H1-type domain-containing protein n=1 Tax=Lymnaea stagnalis TaxID=6523 RepID=A0AAV2INC6_LYMST
MATNCMTLQLLCNRVEAAATLRKLCTVISTVKSVFNVEITHDIAEIQDLTVACISKTNDGSHKNSGVVFNNTVKKNGTADAAKTKEYESVFDDNSPKHGSADIPSSITLCFKAELSQENIEKAKNYVTSHLTPIPDYTTYPFSLDSPSEFEMVFQNSNELQSTTLCLMTFQPDCYEITLQGSEKSVGSARARVVMLLDNFREQKTSDGEKCMDNTRQKSSYVSELVIDSLNDNPVDDEIDVPTYITSEDFLSDPRYSTQVERALKLGYSEDQVSKALKKLGPDIDSNDLLSELIAIGATDSGISERHDKNIDGDYKIYQNVNHNSDNRSSDFFSYSSGEPSFYPLGVGGPNSNQSSDGDSSNNLRHIIIDGSNVAMSHGKKVFSCKGIKIVVDWFLERGHKEITVFVPQWRKETSRPDAPITDQEILSELDKERIVVFTPARRVKGRRVVCYDDRYILNLAKDTDGIVVSNDVYRDLVAESEEYRKVVDQRLLMYSFVNDRFMPPEDPLGRTGPTLDNFLRKTPSESTPKPKESCPYGKKCTYGNKCRYYHPERGFAPQKSITETLKEQADIKIQERHIKMSEMAAEKGRRPKQKLSRTKSFFPEELLTSDGDHQSRRDKPKLAHSKSLISQKTPDYLNEPRKILEKAELTAALEKMDIKEPHNFGFKSCFDEGPISPYFDTGSSKSSSNRTSPVPHREIIKAPVTASSSLPQTSSPLRGVITKSPRASPSHLTVPKPEQQEPYVSGHLLLAKKLSDEGKEAKFFSEHTSSPSSTRTSSPISSSTRFPDQKQQTRVDCLPPYPPPPVAQPYPAQSFPYFKDDNIPNLSIFEHQGSLVSQGKNLNQSLVRRQSVGCSLLPEEHNASAIPKNLFSNISCDSSYSSGSDPLFASFQSQLECPPPVMAKPPINNPILGGVLNHPAEHPNLRRAFSSTGNVQEPYEMSHFMGRRSSAMGPVYNGGERVALKSQNSMPVHHYQQGPYVSPSLGLTRQNSTSDPQIHNRKGLGELQEFYQVDSDQSSPEHFGYQGQQQNPVKHQSYQLLQQQQLEIQQRLGQLHQEQLKQESAVSQPRNTYMPGVGSNFHPFNSSMPPLSQLPPHAVVPNRVPLSPIPTGFPHHFQQAPHSMFPQNYLPNMTPMMSQTSQLPYSQSQMTYMPPQHDQQRNQPAAPYGQTNSYSGQVTSITSEDAPIVPSDPRYAIYYHLSNVFEEASVRKVMNRYPGVLRAEEICNLIINYKQEAH